MLLTPNSNPTICVPQQKKIRPGYVFPTVQFQFSRTLEPQIYFLGRQELSPTWSSAVIAHLPQGSRYYAFREVFLLTTVVVNSDYLSYCSLSVSSNQSIHSPLTSLICKVFLSFMQNYCSLGQLWCLMYMNWSSWPVSVWFYVLHNQPHDWLVEWFHGEAGVSNKVLGECIFCISNIFVSVIVINKRSPLQHNDKDLQLAKDGNCDSF